jgi:copper oxidase (laccase) domain-containing protein
LPIAVLTADCAPVLIYDKKKIIAAIHAGWKGAFKGYINKVIKFMIKKGCNKKYYCC